MPGPRSHELPRWTIAILVPLGFGLDPVFAQWCFDYPTAGAMLCLQLAPLGAREGS